MTLDYRAEGGAMAGDLRMRVGYDVVTQGIPSSYGDSAQVWSRLASLWAEVVVLEGQELMRAKEVHAEARVRITIRYNPAVTTAGRFVYEGQNYYPVSVVADPLKRKMTCLCYVHLQENVT